MEADIHNKDFARRLVLKERLRRTRKWPILKFQNIHLPINVSATCESFADLSQRNMSLIPTAFESAMSASFVGKQIM